MRNLACAFAALSLGAAGCASSPVDPADLPALPAGLCNADPAQGLVGQTATAASGAELLRLTGARGLRWVPPRSAVTMDYRADRLTVRYDDAYVITAVSCG